MTHTIYSQMTDEELLTHVYMKVDVSDLELELAQRLELLQELPTRGVFQNEGMRVTSPELAEVIRSIEHVAQVQLELE